MNKKQNKALEIVSGIDDKIIDENTVKRAILKNKKLNRRPKKTLVVLFAATLVFATLLSTFVVMLNVDENDKQVPIYEGMTVLDNYQENTEELSIYMPYYASSNRLTSFGGFDIKKASPLWLLNNNTNLYEQESKSVEDIIEDEISLTVPEQNMYYAKPGQDIYINVHISNPDNFEILSFTLNGKKYSSYMFEEGSDMENLILKINVGDAEGIVEYTIDAIKYVDGTEIKDVIMEGDKTVKVGIFTDKQPVAQITNEEISIFGLSFDIIIEDEKSLIDNCGGSVFAILIDTDDKVVAKQEIPLGKNNNIVFEDLDGSSEYIRVIAAYYDAYDGEGFSLHILEESKIKTEDLLKITDVSLVGNKIFFDVSFEQQNNVVIEKIDLVSEGVIIQSIDPDLREFGDIDYIGEYYVSISYSYVSFKGEIKVTAVSDRRVKVERISDVSLIIYEGTVTKPYCDYPIWSESMADWREHLGLDIAPSTEDTRVLSASVGTVSAIIDDKYGKAVIVEVKLGGETVEFRYEGLTAIVVEVGDVLIGGQKIGYASAEMCEIADPDHVHFSVYENGTPIDPIKYVEYDIPPEYLE